MFVRLAMAALWTGTPDRCRKGGAAPLRGGSMPWALAPPPVSLRARRTRRQQRGKEDLSRRHRRHAAPGVRGGRRHDQGTAALPTPVCAGGTVRGRPASAAPPCPLSGRCCGSRPRPPRRGWSPSRGAAAPQERTGRARSRPGGGGSAQSSPSLGVWGRPDPAEVNAVLHRAGRYNSPAAGTVAPCPAAAGPGPVPGQGPAGSVLGRFCSRPRGCELTVRPAQLLPGAAGSQVGLFSQVTSDGTRGLGPKFPQGVFKVRVRIK